MRYSLFYIRFSRSTNLKRGEETGLGDEIELNDQENKDQVIFLPDGECDVIIENTLEKNIHIVTSEEKSKSLSSEKSPTTTRKSLSSYKSQSPTTSGLGEKKF